MQSLGVFLEKALLIHPPPEPAGGGRIRQRPQAEVRVLVDRVPHLRLSDKMQYWDIFIVKKKKTSCGLSEIQVEPGSLYF